MKKTKKIVALLLTLCMAFGMFAHMAPVNAEALDWFETATEITAPEFAELTVTTTAGEAKYYEYTAAEDGFFDFISATSTNEEFTCTPYVAVYKADGTEINTTSVAYFNYFAVEAGETYYFEFYSRYYSEGEYRKAADEMTIKAALLTFEAIENEDFAEVVTVVGEGQTKLYKYEAQADGFIDFISGTSANTTEQAPCLPNVKVYNEEARNQFGGNMAVVKALFVKAGQTYIFEISSQKNYKPTADTITWEAQFCAPEELTVPQAGKTVTSVVAENGSKFYKYTSTVDGYFEITEASSAAFVTDPGEETDDFTRFQIYDAVGNNLESGLIENVDPIPVKIGDVIYIEVYSQGGYDYDIYAPIKIADTLTWEVEAYECGTEANPEEIEDMRDFYQELTLDPESYGRYYTYTAPGEGEVVFYPQYWTDGSELEIEVTVGTETYKFSTSEDMFVIDGYWGPEEFKAVKIAVEEDDVLDIHVYELGEEINEIGLVGQFTPPVGQSGNPLNVSEEGAEIEIAAGTTYHIQIPYGMAAVLEATGAFTVVGTDYDELLTEEMESVDGKLTVKGCYKLAITNEETTAITVNVAIEYPEGSMENPYKLSCYNELDLRFDANQMEFEYYQFTAKEDCTLYFDMPEIETGAVTGWMIQMYVFDATGTCTGYVEMHPWLAELNNEVPLAADEYVIMSISPAVYSSYEYGGQVYDYVSPGAMEATRIQCKIATITENPFTDIEAGQYYETPVLWAYANDVTAGLTETNFGVGTTCTRAQIVTFLWRAAGRPDPVATQSPFTDVTDTTSYFYKAVLWAAENGITSGYEDESFGIDDPCTRAQIVTFLWRAAGRPAAAATTSPFTDVADANAYYYNAVLWAVENGITYGLTETLFGVDEPCTREQVVTFLYRAFK